MSARKTHKSQSWSKVHWNWKPYSSFWILKLLLGLFKVDSSRAFKSWVLCLSKLVEKTLAFPSSPSISVPGRGLHGSENSRPQLFPIFIQFYRWNVFVTLRSFNASNWQCKDVSQCPIRLERHNADFKTARTSATGLPTEATCPTKRWTVAVSLEGPFRSWQSTVSQRPSWIFERNHTFSSPFSYIMDPSNKKKVSNFSSFQSDFPWFEWLQTQKKPDTTESKNARNTWEVPPLLLAFTAFRGIQMNGDSFCCFFDLICFLRLELKWKMVLKKYKNILWI